MVQKVELPVLIIIDQPHVTMVPLAVVVAVLGRQDKTVRIQQPPAEVSMVKVVLAVSGELVQFGCLSWNN